MQRESDNAHVPATPSSLPTLGRVLRAYRTEAGLTQEALGYRTGLARNYVGMVERGEANISFTAMERWLSATGITWERLGRDLHDALDQTNATGAK
jgi:transcriptional regulator with XRE-family HTH domain